jgi:hypothetical protein
MVITTDDVIKYVNAFTFLSCQTAAESTASTNTNADILYTSQSSNQGNFLLFYGIADSQITSDLAKNSITLRGCPGRCAAVGTGLSSTGGRVFMTLDVGQKKKLKDLATGKTVSSKMSIDAQIAAIRKQVEVVSKAGKVPLDTDFKALCDIAESMKTKEK